MSLISIYNETIETITTPYIDVKGNEKQNTTQSITYTEVKDQYAVLHVDLLGNTYLKHNHTYYIVSIDEYTPSGVELTRISNPDVFRKILIESQNLKQGVKSGSINNNSTTLRGKAYENISNMTDEEKSEHMEKNEFMTSDNGCDEKKYFWVKYDEEYELDEDEIADGFYLNGLVNESEIGIVSGIVNSDLLSPVAGSFEVILIQGDIGSKRVVSNVEKIDRYCTSTLTIFTSGKMKTNFVERTKLARLCLDSVNGELITKPCLN